MFHNGLPDTRQILESSRVIEAEMDRLGVKLLDPVRRPRRPLTPASIPSAS